MKISESGEQVISGPICSLIGAFSVDITGARVYACKLSAVKLLNQSDGITPVGN